MTLRIADIPDQDDPRDFTAWLESQLVCPGLRELAAELAAFQDLAQREAAKADTLELRFGDRLDKVLDSGLTMLPEAEQRMLLQRPELLLDLQRRIAVEGGRYWDRVAERKYLEDAQVAKVASHQRFAGFWTRRRALLAVAATTLAALSYYFWPSEASPAWGFDKSGLLTARLPAPDYLRSLAKAAKEWHQQRPESFDQLQRRLEQFRDGCDTLIRAPHPQLTAADRDWLRERCGVWAETIKKHIAVCQRRDVPLPEIRAAADVTIDTLIAALEKRAKEAAAEA